jgi:hypothetical protein
MLTAATVNPRQVPHRLQCLVVELGIALRGAWLAIVRYYQLRASARCMTVYERIKSSLKQEDSTTMTAEPWNNPQDIGGRQ